MKTRFAAVALMALSIFPSAWSAAASEEGAAAQEILANEVRIYLQPGFAGPYKTWKLEPGMRQRFVQEFGAAWEGRIISVLLGSDVGAMLFQNKYFKFSGSGYNNFASSVSDIRVSVPGATGNFASLILYPLPNRNPLGILAGNSSLSEFRFFPMPEQSSERTASFADIRHLMAPADFIMFFHGDGDNEKVVLTLFADILYQGESLRLPDAGGADHYQLSAHNFAGKAESLKMDLPAWKAQLKAKAKFLELLHVAGRWRCSDQRVFEIVQTGSEISWTDLDSGVKGKGKVRTDDLEVAWPDLYGQRTATWTIIGRDSGGQPTKLDIGNGLELTRLSTLIKPLKR